MIGQRSFDSIVSHIFGIGLAVLSVHSGRTVFNTDIGTNRIFLLFIPIDQSSQGIPFLTVQTIQYSLGFPIEFGQIIAVHVKINPVQLLFADSTRFNLIVLQFRGIVGFDFISAIFHIIGPDPVLHQRIRFHRNVQRIPDFICIIAIDGFLIAVFHVERSRLVQIRLDTGYIAIVFAAASGIDDQSGLVKGHIRRIDRYIIVPQICSLGHIQLIPTFLYVVGMGIICIGLRCISQIQICQQFGRIIAIHRIFEVAGIAGIDFAIDRGHCIRIHRGFGPFQGYCRIFDRYVIVLQRIGIAYVQRIAVIRTITLVLDVIGLIIFSVPIAVLIGARLIRQPQIRKQLILIISIQSFCRIIQPAGIGFIHCTIGGGLPIRIHDELSLGHINGPGGSQIVVVSDIDFISVGVFDLQTIKGNRVLIGSKVSRIPAFLIVRILTAGFDGSIIGDRIALGDIGLGILPSFDRAVRIPVGLFALTCDAGLPFQDFQGGIFTFEHIAILSGSAVQIDIQVIDGIFPISTTFFCGCVIPARTGSRTHSAICTIFPHTGYNDALPFRDRNIVGIFFFLESISELVDIVEFPVHPGKFFPVHHIALQLISYVIPVGFDLVFHIKGYGGRSLEDELVLIGTIGRKLGRIRSPLGICSAVQVLSKGILFRGSTIYLPFALGINGLRAGSLIHKFALGSLGIDHHGIIGRAGRFQHTAVGVLPIVIHAGAQGNLTGIPGGGQADLAAAGSRCTVIIGTGRNAVNFNIARRENGHVILVCIFQRSRSIRFRIFSGMDFAAYGYIACTGNLKTMIHINSAIVVVCHLIGCIPDFHRTGIFDVQRIQSLSFTNVSLKIDCALASVDFQAGIGQVGFLDKAPGGFTAKVGIVPLVVTAVTNGQERTIVIRLCNGFPPRFIGTPGRIQSVDFFPIFSSLPIRRNRIPEFGTGIIFQRISFRILICAGSTFRAGNPVKPIH